MDEKFTRKARLVAGGHTTDPPASITYSSVVFIDSFHILFMIAALIDIDVYVPDIGNAYLNSLCWGNILTIAGPEFCSNEVSTILIVRTTAT